MKVRQALARRWEKVSTQWGEVRIKIASMNGTVTNYAPEYEDLPKHIAHRRTSRAPEDSDSGSNASIYKRQPEIVSE